MVEKLNITIPTSLMEVTIGQYQRFLKETENITDEAILEQKVITIFCGITINQLRLLKSNQVQDILSRLMPLVDSFGTPQPFTHRFNVGGIEYGFIPNLEQDITYGENKDITSRMSEGIDGMHKAMAILYRPIIRTSNDTYEIEKYQVPVKHEDALKEMPLSVVLGAQVFFWNLTRELLMHIPSYLVKAMGEEEYSLMMKKVSTNQIGEAMTKSSASLKEILEDLTK